MAMMQFKKWLKEGNGWRDWLLSEELAGEEGWKAALKYVLKNLDKIEQQHIEHHQALDQLEFDIKEELGND